MVFNVLPRKTKSASAGDHDLVGLLLHVVIYIYLYMNILILRSDFTIQKLGLLYKLYIAELARSEAASTTSCGSNMI